MPNEGSLFLVICLIVLQGVTGISFGLVISAGIDDEQSANQAALGIFYPNLILSGKQRLTPHVSSPVKTPKAQRATDWSVKCEPLIKDRWEPAVSQHVGTIFVQKTGSEDSSSDRQS